MGWPVFGLPPWKNFRRRDRRSSHSDQEDGCSSLPCRDVLSLRAAAREGPGDETPRVHHAAWLSGAWPLEDAASWAIAGTTPPHEEGMHALPIIIRLHPVDDLASGDD